MHWNSKEQAFAVEAYFTNGCSVIATQSGFCNRFNLAPSDSVLNHKSIIPRVTTFRHTASATRTGVPWPIRSPENIEAVTGPILQSPWRSARKHVSALGLSNRSVKWILHNDIHYQPYKMLIVQELSERDLNSWRNACRGFSKMFLRALLFILVTKPIFISVDLLTNQICITRLTQFPRIASKAFVFT